MHGANLTLEGLVHDLNNVFQTVAEAAEVLQSDPKWKSVSRTMQRSVERGQRIVQSMLDTNRTGLELAPILETAIQFTKDYLESAHGPDLAVCRQVEAGFLIKGPPGRWERVLVNLLVNAAQAGARKVWIEAAANEIVIRDDGAGIPPELLPRIFQPHVSTKPITSGLGLYVVQSIVEQEGGKVTRRTGLDAGRYFGFRSNRLGKGGSGLRSGATPAARR